MSAFTFHPEPIQGSNAIERCMFGQGTPFVVLLAEMQSGKTGTYMHFALKAICDGRFDRVLIVSGTSDTALREQTKDDLKNAIESFACIYAVIPDLIFKMQKNIKVCFGKQVSKINVGEKLFRTLIIHDESHYAQSKENIPFKNFYKKYGFEKALSGDFSILRKNECAILDVSATPFSELIQNENVKSSQHDIVLEEKGVVHLKTGDGYIGVKEFNNSGKIQFSSKPITENRHEHLIPVLRNYRNDKKFLVVRTQRADKDRELIKRIANSLELEYREIFGGSSKKSFEILKQKPNKTTIIHLCGKARMGQVLHKEHIAMMYESSVSPNADTLLQGLLGRCCGYHRNNNIDIFVSHKRKDEISKYIKAFDNDNVSKQQELLSTISPAMNVVNDKKRFSYDGEYFETHPEGEYMESNWNRKTIPIKINITKFNKYQDPNDTLSSFGSEKDLIDQSLYPNIIIALKNSNILENHPDKDIILDILEKNGECAFKSRRRWANYSTSISELEIASENFERCVPKKLFPIMKDGMIKTCAGLGIICSPKNIISFGFIECSKPEFDISPNCLSIKNKCNYSPFACEQEDENIIVGNGAQVILFPHESSTDPIIFENSLKDAINRTNSNHETYIPGCICTISSNWCNSGKEYKGIRFPKDNYNDIEISRIKKTVESQCNVTLKFNKSRGNPGNNFIKYASITWEFKI